MSNIIIDIAPRYKQFQRQDGTILVLLKRAIYGCLESAKLWYKLISSILIKDGYTSNPLDACIFNKTLTSGKQVTIIVYVDDLKFTSVSLDDIYDTINVIQDTLKCELKVNSTKVHSYLGMTWDYTVPGKCKVTMTGYTTDLLADASVSGTIGSPAADHLFTINEAATKLDQTRKERFHSLVAKTAYLGKRTRPDILLPISFLATRVQAPDDDDWKKLERVFRYLNGTTELGIILTADPSPHVIAHIDASYGVHGDFKSHSGMVISLGAGPIDASSTKQKINTKSSAEAELIALSDKATRAIWCREFLTHQGHSAAPATLYQDNESTIKLSTNGVASSDRTRHVSIRYFWIKDRCATGDVEVIYKPTDEMVADILTKPLHGEKFKELRSLLLNWDSSTSV
jgi:histone deacetylase 1/2